MNVLIIGFGSIGARHAIILSELSLQVFLVTSRQDVPFKVYRSIQEAVEQIQFEYIIIANETARHLETLETMAQLGYTGTLLVEKPLTHLKGSEHRFPFSRLYVGYNLRFHPALQQLKAILTNQKIITCHAYVGQYLPDWRPGTDYRLSYSAHRQQGGGVLRDLSHELDYLLWLCGNWTQVTAKGGKLSQLDITSEDCVSALLQTTRCPLVTAHLNYLDRTPRRMLIVNTTEETYMIDFITGTLSDSQGRHCRQYNLERNDTYLRQHQAVLAKDETYLCDYRQALNIQSLIAAIDLTLETPQGRWITS